MARRYFSSTAVATTLSASANNVTTSITVTALAGFPNLTPFTAILDEGTAAEEVVDVTNVSGTTLTVTRGVDGTSAVAHNAGATFKHGISGRDFDESSAHVNASTGVHGVAGAVVGTTDTQTLTNKTLTAPVIASISNAGTVTVPSGTQTLVARATTDTLTNKTIDSATNTLTVAQSAVTGLATALAAKADVANPTVTGVLSVPDGTAAAPSITNTGDTDTGLLFPAADTVAISTGGTERVRVTSAGRLGVGNTAPVRQLHSSSADNDGALLAGATLGIRIFSGAVASTIEGVDSTGSASYQPLLLGGSTVSITTSNTQRLLVDANGLITGTGTSLGAWTAYTPALTASTTDPTLGAGSITTGVFCQIGKTVHYTVRIVFGTSGTAAGSGQYRVSLPISAKATGHSNSRGHGRVGDSSTGKAYTVEVMVTSPTLVVMNYTEVADGSQGVVTEGAPFASGASDFIIITGTYEAA